MKTYITKQEVEKILEVMKEFDDAYNYRLEADNSSGIGRTLSLIMDMEIANRPVEVKVEINNVETW